MAPTEGRFAWYLNYNLKEFKYWNCTDTEMMFNAELKLI